MKTCFNIVLLIDLHEFNLIYEDLCTTWFAKT